MWVNHLVWNSFQTLVNRCHDFFLTCENDKYNEEFEYIGYSLQKAMGLLFQEHMSDDADVAGANISTAIQTQLQLIIRKKTGTKNQTAFSSKVTEVQKALTDFSGFFKVEQLRIKNMRKTYKDQAKAAAASASVEPAHAALGADDVIVPVDGPTENASLVAQNDESQTYAPDELDHVARIDPQVRRFLEEKIEGLREGYVPLYNLPKRIGRAFHHHPIVMGLSTFSFTTGVFVLAHYSLEGVIEAANQRLQELGVPFDVKLIAAGGLAAVGLFSAGVTTVATNATCCNKKRDRILDPAVDFEMVNNDGNVGGEAWGNSEQDVRTGAQPAGIPLNRLKKTN